MIELKETCKAHLQKLCTDIDNRCVGSKGNIQAANYFEDQLKLLGWSTQRQTFEAFDWYEGSAFLQVKDIKVPVYISPYTIGCEINGGMVFASDVRELENIDAENKILVIHDELTKEQLMPKNFIFYNPEAHQRKIQLFEKSKAKAIICIISPEGYHEGGEYPFPIIEDGDFDIPSVFMSSGDGQILLDNTSCEVKLVIDAKRVPSYGFNVLGSRGKESSKQITITAHIDAKKGSPGALDNATGVVTLLLLAKLLDHYEGPFEVQLIAFNGEDYYSVPGQMTYIKESQTQFANISLNINIDGVGYHEGATALSFFNLPEIYEKKVEHIIGKFEGIVHGAQWVQGDHSIFLQFGIPAIAISSDWLIQNLADQDITHTTKDNLSIVDSNKLIELAMTLNRFILEVR